MNKPRFRLLALSALLPLLAGCFRSDRPDQFYMLRAVATAPAGPVPADGGPRVGLGPIRIPAYLDRPQIVTAVSEQEYRLSDTHRWAERLDVTLARVSVENLGNLIPTERIVPHPWPRESAPDIQLTMNVQEFHVDQHSQARLEALWTLRQGKNIALNRKFSCRLPVPAGDYSGMVEAESQCLGRLNREMAAAVRSFGTDSGAGR
jgi:uncharacterized lipoprotein YmbA